MSLNKVYRGYWSWKRNTDELMLFDCKTDVIEDYFIPNHNYNYSYSYSYCKSAFNFDDFVKYLTEHNIRFGYIRIFDKNNNNHFRYTLPIEINLIHKLCPVEIKFRRYIHGLGVTYFHLRIIADCKNNEDLTNKRNIINRKRIDYYDDLLKLINERKSIDGYDELFTIVDRYYKSLVFNNFNPNHICTNNLRINNKTYTNSEYNDIIKSIHRNKVFMNSVINRINYDLQDSEFAKFDLE